MGKRGRKPDHAKTVAMYQDYCVGMTTAQVAEKWGFGQTGCVTRRFASLGLPLRAATGVERNPYKAQGAASLYAANEERTRRAAEVTIKRAKAAMDGAPNAYSRGVLQLRIDHPGASLTELGALHEPPLTKDAVSGVIRRAKDWVTS